MRLARSIINDGVMALHVYSNFYFMVDGKRYSRFPLSSFVNRGDSSKSIYMRSAGCELSSVIIVLCKRDNRTCECGGFRILTIQISEHALTLGLVWLTSKEHFL